MWWRAFFSAGFAAHWQSFREIFTVVFVSTIPITLNALAAYYTDQTSNSYFASLFNELRNGELLFYALAITGTITWLANRDWLADISEGTDGNKGVGHRVRPPKLWFNLFSLGTVAICALFFGIDYFKVRLTRELLSLSSYIYATSILVWYIINVMCTAPPPSFDETLAQGVASLGSRLMLLRGKKKRPENGA